MPVAVPASTLTFSLFSRPLTHLFLTRVVQLSEDEHNEVCEVCDIGGNVLCCDFCSLVVHLDCLKPPLDNIPMGKWMCPACIVERGLGPVCCPHCGKGGITTAPELEPHMQQECVTSRRGSKSKQRVPKAATAVAAAVGGVGAGVGGGSSSGGAGGHGVAASGVPVVAAAAASAASGKRIRRDSAVVKGAHESAANATPARSHKKKKPEEGAASVGSALGSPVLGEDGKKVWVVPAKPRRADRSPWSGCGDVVSVCA